MQPAIRQVVSTLLSLITLARQLKCWRKKTQFVNNCGKTQWRFSGAQQAPHFGWAIFMKFHSMTSSCFFNCGTTFSQTVTYNSNAFLPADTKSIAQIHTFCTTLVKKNTQNRTFYNSVGGWITGWRLKTSVGGWKSNRQKSQKSNRQTLFLYSEKQNNWQKIIGQKFRKRQNFAWHRATATFNRTFCNGVGGRASGLQTHS